MSALFLIIVGGNLLGIGTRAEIAVLIADGIVPYEATLVPADRANLAKWGVA